jgi:hypothetical protein
LIGQRSATAGTKASTARQDAGHQADMQARDGEKMG